MKARHLLCHVVFLVYALQGSHVHCERVTALTGSTASHSPRAFAGDVSRNYSLSEDFRRISILRTIFRSIADFLEFPGINVGDKNIEQDRSRNLDNPSEDDIEDQRSLSIHQSPNTSPAPTMKSMSSVLDQTNHCFHVV